MKLALGIDFGTESARAVLVDCADGSEVGASVEAYEHGVIDARLPAPDEDVELEPDWALQDPRDYVRSLQAAVRGVLAETGVSPDDVVGIGIDFTSCTMLPTLADGTPLCELDELRREPHAWVKLWKHHAAQPEADRINAVAAERGEPWLPRYGGRISSEWFFAKALQILDEAPEVYARAERLIEACDWIVWQLTGVESRNACAAGYKAMWSKRDGFPRVRLLRRARPALRARRRREDVAHAAAAGLARRRAERARGRVDGPARRHAGRGRERRLPRLGAGDDGHRAGDARDDHGHEQRASAARRGARARRGHVRRRRGRHRARATSATRRASRRSATSTRGSRRTRPDTSRTSASSTRRGGDSCGRARPGLLALDWWNGNRSVLVDADLRGLLVGMTLATRAPDIYRALIEATAFGTRVIVEAFERRGASGRRDRRLRRPARPQPARDAGVRGRHRPRDRGRGLAPGACARRGDVRRRRCGRRRWLRLDRRRVAVDGAPERNELRAAGPRTVRRTTSSTASTCGSTISSGAAATT